MAYNWNMIRLALVATLAVGCAKAIPESGGETSSTQPGGQGTISTSLGNLPVTDKAGWKIETVAEGLEVPWAIAWAPDGRMFFTERPGRVRVIENGKLVAEPMITLTDVIARSEAGLMGFCVHPDFKINHFVYLAYSYGDYVRVVRYTEANNKLASPKIIIDQIPSAMNHAGTRCAFGPDGKLYITTGDATDWRRAQQMDSINGKTLRLNDDGSVPADNPFVGKSDVRPEIWSYGHRNAQGLDWQPGTGLMFQTEHGPSGFEGLGGGACELNAVERGKNYGWPEVYGTRTKSGMEPPLVEYTPAAAPGSGAFYKGDKIAAFKGNYFFGSLRGTSLIRVVLDGRKVVKQERVIADLGRIREVQSGPDGALYFSTSNRDGRGRGQDGDDRIMRIVAQ